MELLDKTKLGETLRRGDRAVCCGEGERGCAVRVGRRPHALNREKSGRIKFWAGSERVERTKLVEGMGFRSPRADIREGCESLIAVAGPAGLTLILSCCGNILILRSEAGRTMEWAQAHFFVGPVAVL